MKEVDIMQQLWLMGKRIDSIDMLRSQFAEVDEEQRDRLCVRMLEHLKAGVVRRWLNRQPTSVFLSDQALKTSVELLKDGKEADQYSALAVICGIPESSFSSEELHHTIDKKEHAKQARMELLKKQSWWKVHSELFESVTDWNLVVTDDAQLQTALDMLPKSGHAGNSRAILYLCNTDANPSYRLNLRNVYHTTIIGVENPRVMHTRLPDKVFIDAKVQNISLRDFTLRCPKRKYIRNHDDSGNGFEQKVT